MFAFLNKLSGSRETSDARSRLCQPAIRKGARRRQLELEGLEQRLVPSGLTGFSFVEQQGFPIQQTTVVSVPTIFKDTLDQTWSNLANGTQLISGQTLQQLFTGQIQQSAQQQQVTAYNISESFGTQGSYSATLGTSSGNPTVQIQYAVAGDTTTFTTTTNTIFGSGEDPTFHVSFDMTIGVNLTLPSTLSPQATVNTSATVTISNVDVTSHNVLVGLANIFGTNVCQEIANGFNGSSANVSSLAPAGQLNTLVQSVAGQGFNKLLASLDSSGNLLLTAQSPNLIINGSASTSMVLDVDSDSSGGIDLVLNGQAGQFPPGRFSSITVNAVGPTSTIDVETLPGSVSLGLNLSNQAAVNFSPNALSKSLLGSDLSGIHGPVTISGKPTSLAITLHDQEGQGARTIGIDSNALSLPDGDTVAIQTPVVPSITLWTTVSSNASSQVNISPVSENLHGIGQLTIHGGASTNLNVNDQLGSTSDYTIAAGQLTGGSATINYDNIKSVTLNAGNNSPNTVNVENISIQTTVKGGAATSQINVAPTSQNLDNIGADLSITGASAAVSVYDQANPHGAASGTPTVYTVADGVTRDATFVQQPSNSGAEKTVVQTSVLVETVKSLTLYTSHSPNDVTVTVGNEGYAVSVISGAADTITAPTFSGLEGTNAQATINADGGTLTLDDRGLANDIDDTYTVGFTVTDKSIVRSEQDVHQVSFPGGKVPVGDGGVTTVHVSFGGTIDYQNVQSLTIDGGAVATSFNVQSTPAGVPVTINGNPGGSNQFRLGVNGLVSDIRSLVTLNGGSLKDTLVMDDSSSTAQSQATISNGQANEIQVTADNFFGAGGSLDTTGLGSITLDLSKAAGDTVSLGPNSVTAFFINANGTGAELDLGLTGVTNPQESQTSSSSGKWTFGNRAAVSFQNMTVKTHE